MQHGFAVFAVYALVYWHFKLLSKDIPVSPKKGKISLNLCPSALSLLEIYAWIVLLVGFVITLPKI